MLWQCSGNATWLQHKNGPSPPVRKYTLTASAFAFRPVHESSGGPLPLHHSTPTFIDLLLPCQRAHPSNKCPILTVERRRAGDSSRVAGVHPFSPIGNAIIFFVLFVI
ncbi:hypothetical protein EVAR_10130_1 [Eumeta japonica]|uniref:Uncharacterized protein n=1 Tax=Eumeta variegata TaxID=151549 RepID=A0A4C1UCE4_EUMVA|nr:hypothetical protein EVAR_10130_1 [Eumeta japonica]